MSMRLLQVWLTQNVCRWVPRQIGSEIEIAELGTSQRIIARYDSEGNDFAYSILTGDESWMHHYGSQIKSQALEYRHPPYNRKKKITFRRKLHAHTFLGLQSYFTKLKSESFVKKLKRLTF